jgi:outer membrane protein assembly factor BamB
MAAIDLRDGRVLPWAPAFRTEPGGARGALTLALVGGNVTAGGVGNVTAYDGRTGRKRWSLDVDLAHDRSVPALNGAVDSQVVVGGGRLFVAGAFDRIRAAPAGRWIHIGARAAPAELDPRTGRVLTWRAARSLGDEIVSLAAYRNTLFVAGHGSGYRVSLKSGQVLGPIRGRPTAVAASGGILYLGGNLYDRLNIPNRNNLAAMDLGTGRVTAFAPRLTKFQSPGKIVVSGGHVLAVGEFVKSLG